ncbi:MAG: hypothetical protein LBR45_05325 [Bacteroidales bacterium]|nr:hypothetical protein [Bacteroidales bacterium]
MASLLAGFAFPRQVFFYQSVVYHIFNRDFTPDCVRDRVEILLQRGVAERQKIEAIARPLAAGEWEHPKLKK